MLRALERDNSEEADFRDERRIKCSSLTVGKDHYKIKTARRRILGCGEV